MRPSTFSIFLPSIALNASQSLTEQTEQYVRTQKFLPLPILLSVLAVVLSSYCCCNNTAERSRCQNTWLWTAKIYGPSGPCHFDQLGQRRRWRWKQTNTKSRPHFAGSSIPKKNCRGVYVCLCLLHPFFFGVLQGRDITENGSRKGTQKSNPRVGRTPERVVKRKKSIRIRTNETGRGCVGGCVWLCVLEKMIVGRSLAAGQRKAHKSKSQIPWIFKNYSLILRSSAHGAAEMVRESESLAKVYCFFVDCIFSVSVLFRKNLLKWIEQGKKTKTRCQI